MFTEQDVRAAGKVCIIGKTVAKQLFPNEEPVGSILRIRNIPFKILGVLSRKGLSIMGSDQDDVVIIPYTSAMKRVSRRTNVNSITAQIEPTSPPRVFNTLNDAKQALQTHQIAALVADTPTAQFISSSEIKNSVMVAQFPSTGEHFGLLFSKGNPLVGCVNKALATLKSNGTLQRLQNKYLQVYLSVPTIQP